MKSAVAERIAKYFYDLETEDRLTRVGLREDANLAAVQANYADLFTLEQVKEAEATWQGAKGDNREAAHRIFRTLQDGYFYNHLVEADDALTSKLLKTTVTVDGESIKYFELAPRFQKEPDFAKRERIYTAFAQANQDVLPENKQLLATTLQILKDDFGETNLVKHLQQVKNFSYQPFLKCLRKLHQEIWPTYEAAMGARVREVIGKPFGNLSAVHAGYLGQFPEIELLFPQAGLQGALGKTLDALGMPLGNQPNIHIDLEDRPNKNPRAVCYAPDPPSEVHLIIKPIGGMYDYEAFMHEAGHALHFGNTEAALPVPFRLLSTSHALTEVYSYLFEHLVYDPLWLEWALGLSAEDAAKASRLGRLQNLFMLMRYIGKLDYEFAFYDEPTNWSRNAELYSEKLGKAAGFVYPEENFLYDMDSGLYAADYLRAWVTQAQLTKYLKKEFGRKWFTTPEAGAFLKSLWAEGTRPENEEISKRIGATPHDTGALARSFAELT